MKWFRIAHRDGEIEERQFSGLIAALEYAIKHGARVYEWNCGWRKVCAW